MDEFKEFVRNNPNLISYVKNEEMTCQKFYEIYKLYGEDSDVWKEYLSDNKNENKKQDKIKMPSSFHEVVEMAKRLDVNKVQEGITSLQKAISLFGDLFVNNNTNNNENNGYQPRPVYRSFDD